MANIDPRVDQGYRHQLGAMAFLRPALAAHQGNWMACLPGTAQSLNSLAESRLLFAGAINQVVDPVAGKQRKRFLPGALAVAKRDQRRPGWLVAHAGIDCRNVIVHGCPV
jgi:hypothetical protein